MGGTDAADARDRLRSPPGSEWLLDPRCPLALSGRNHPHPGVVARRGAVAGTVSGRVCAAGRGARRQSLWGWAARGAEAGCPQSLPRDLRGADLLPYTLVCRSSEQAGNPTGGVSARRGRSVHRQDLSRHRAAAGAAVARLQQVGMGRVDSAAAASGGVRPGGAVGCARDDGVAESVRLGGHIRHAREFRALSDSTPGA